MTIDTTKVEATYTEYFNRLPHHTVTGFQMHEDEDGDPAKVQITLDVYVHEVRYTMVQRLFTHLLRQADCGARYFEDILQRDLRFARNV